MCSELQEEGKPDLPSYGMGVLPSSVLISIVRPVLIQ